MLILNPRQVTFASTTFTDVTSVAINRDTTRLALNHTDHGPHPTFADAPEQRTTIELTMDLPRGDLNAPTPGAQGTLTLTTSPTASDAQRRTLTATAVVTKVEHHVTLNRGATRTITLIALSPNGSTDPITITDA
jgi:hypothetical protein